MTITCHKRHPQPNGAAQPQGSASAYGEAWGEGLTLARSDPLGATTHLPVHLALVDHRQRRERLHDDHLPTREGRCSREARLRSEPTHLRVKIAHARVGGVSSALTRARKHISRVGCTHGAHGAHGCTRRARSHLPSRSGCSRGRRCPPGRRRPCTRRGPSMRAPVAPTSEGRRRSST
eukprot:217121-Prymnesium_polylepis.1